MSLVAAYMLNRLKEWGVHRVYGYPGDGINGFLGAFEEVEEPVFTQVRHEEMGAFMACAHAKFTGELGVAMATSGPGAIHTAGPRSGATATIGRPAASTASSRPSRGWVWTWSRSKAGALLPAVRKAGASTVAGRWVTSGRPGWRA